MTDFFKDLIGNSINNLSDNLTSTGESYQREWRLLAKELGGRYDQEPQGSSDKCQVDPDTAKKLAVPQVLLKHKQWTLEIIPMWVVPPPIGPLAFVRCTYSKRTDFKLSFARKRNVRIGNALKPLAKPAKEGFNSLIKLLAPTFEVPDRTSEQEKKDWQSAVAVTTGVPEIDNVYLVVTDNARAVKKMFSDFRVREAFLQIDGLQQFAIDPTTNSVTLSQKIAGSNCKDKVKPSVEFLRAALDRLTVDGYM